MLVQIHTGLTCGVERQSHKMKKCSEAAAFEISQEYLTLILTKRQQRSSAIL